RLSEDRQNVLIGQRASERRLALGGWSQIGLTYQLAQPVLVGRSRLRRRDLILHRSTLLRFRLKLPQPVIIRSEGFSGRFFSRRKCSLRFRLNFTQPVLVRSCRLRRRDLILHRSTLLRFRLKLPQPVIIRSEGFGGCFF